MTEKKNKIVFISSPYAGAIDTNVAFARDACRYAIHRGYIPIAPHLIYPAIIPDADPQWRHVGIQMGCELLAVCGEIWMCGPCATSGMQTELKRAAQIGLKIRWVTCEEIQRGLEEEQTQLSALLARWSKP